MNLWPWSKKPAATTTAVKEAGGTQINKTNFKNFIVKAIGFIASQGAARGEFTQPEYNLEEIKAAADADSYIKMALMKYSYLMFKAGYSLKSDNDKAVEYLNMRFRMMSFSTGKPMDILWQEVADDLVKYSNAFLVKSRVDKLMPGIQAKGVFADKPIGGYFRVDPASIKIKRDKNGAVKSYQQGAEGADQKTFQPTEVIHFYLDKDANNAFGTPRIIAALEDVKMLRRIEGNIVTLIYRFAIPIYQWIIGLPTAGFQATDKEIQEAQAEIERMPLDGVIVTNEKTEIKAIGAEGNALDASKYLEYFERRVFTALGTSESQMGRGGAKQDADSMEAQVHDTVKYIQRTMSTIAENYILNELLLEGGFNPIFNEQDIVQYEFNEISLDTKIKVENHEMAKFQGNVIPFEEMRKQIGKRSDTIDEQRLYKNMIEQKAALEQIDAKNQGAKEIAGMRGSEGGGTQGNGKTASQKPNGTVKNKNTPKNQHGTSSVKIKSDMDDEIAGQQQISESVEVEEASKKLRNHRKNFSTIYKRYETLRNDITDTDVDLDMVFPLTKDSLMMEIKTLIQMNSTLGMQHAVNEINSDGSATYVTLPNMNLHLDKFYDESESTIKGVLSDIKKKIKDDRSVGNVKAVFDTFEYRLRYLIEFILPKVYWYSFVKAGAHLGKDKAYVQFHKDSRDAEEHPAVINTKAFSIDDIPAYHSFCNCKVSFNKVGDKD